MGLMRYFCLVVFAFIGINSFFTSVAFAELEKPIVIKSITHNKDSETKETITFTLSAFVVPKIFTLMGDNPRLVIDFPQSTYRGKNVISITDSVLARAIRLGLHQAPIKKTRAVIDLSKDMAVQYTSEFLEQENTLIITLLPDMTGPMTEPQATAVQDIQVQSPEVQPSQEKLSENLLNKKTMTQVSSVKEEKLGPVAESTATPAVPTILEISFDNSSGKGEMVFLRINNFSPPIVSAIEKDSPRVLCDFKAMKMGENVKKTILANGKYIERIRTVIHQDPEKVRVVLDLAANRDYDLQQVFYKKESLFVLIVNELTLDQGVQ